MSHCSTTAKRASRKHVRSLHTSSVRALEALEARTFLAAEPFAWPAGPELLVANAAYSTPAIAMDSDGDFILAWEHLDFGYYGTYGDTRVRRYNAAGVAQGAEIQVNAVEFNGHGPLAVAMDADGDFIVVWQRYADIFAQRYNAAGAAQGTTFLVTPHTGSQYTAAVAMDADGDFVIAWSGVGQGDIGGVFAQRYSAAGVPQGTEFRVNAGTTLDDLQPSVAMDADGDFVVAWTGGFTSYAVSVPDDIFVQRFNSAGVKQGVEFRANTYTTGPQRDASAVMDASGDFVITWTSEDQDGSYGGIYAQRYSASGVAQAAEFRVNTQTASAQHSSSAAMTGDGDFVIAWAGAGGIRAQRYDPAGAALGPEFRVTSDTTGASGVAIQPGGNFVAAWQSSYADLKAQRYTTFGPADAAIIGDRVWNDTNANGIQDAGEPGIAGATVELFTADGVAFGSFTTNATGQYSIPVLAGASTFLHFVTPAGFLPTRANEGGNDDVDSDADRVTGLTPTFSAAAGATNASIDAGFSAPTSIAGGAFYDRDGNGVRNGAEEGMAGFQVFLDLDADGTRDPNEPTTSTDGVGNYAFSNLFGDAYGLVVVNQDLWVEPAVLPILAVPGSANQINLALRTAVADRFSQPLGSEFRANSYTTGNQEASSIAIDSNGNFVVVWQGAGLGDDFGIFAQRYSSAGVAQGAEFRANTYTTNTQHSPSTAMDSDGDFVVTWTSDAGASGNGIYAQRFNAAGVKQGFEFKVNSYSTGYKTASAVAMDAGGNFVVAWSGAGEGDGVGIFAQRFNAAGVMQASEFRVNTGTPLNELTPTVAMDADGDFTVAWTSGYQGYYYYVPYSIHAQRYNAAGVAQGIETTVGVGTVASAAMDPAGDLVIAWQSGGISVQRFNAAGVAQGTECFVGDGSSPRAAIDADGDFVITWQGAGIVAQRYNAAGVKQGAQFRVNSFTNGSTLAPAAAMQANGDFVVAWHSNPQDGSFNGIYAQRYTTFSTVSSAAVGDRVWNDTNGNGLQDNGEPAIAGATIELYNSGGAFISSTTTDANGHYTLSALAGTAVYLQFITPSGFIPTRADQGADNNLDSDADRTTGRSAPFTAGAAGTTNNSVDAGFVVPASLGGVVFNDRSGDGVRNGGEEALRGFQVFADLDNDGALDAGEPTTNTGPDGSYRFDNLLNGTYRIVVVGQDLWVEPASSPVVVAVGAAVTQANVPARTTTHDTVSVSQGNEFRVNTYTTGWQYGSSVAMDLAGNFVVSWNGRGSGDQYGIFAQRYNAAGTKQGNEFRVNSYTTGDQSGPSAAMDDTGNFVIAWSGRGSGDTDGVFAQRYNAAGATQGNPFRVNTFTTSNQYEPVAAMDANGDFIISWSSYTQDGSGAGAYAQRYNAAGAAQGAEFRLNSYTTGSQYSSSVVMEDNGDFLAVWRSDGPDVGGVYGERFNGTGVSQGAEFYVGNGSAPSAAMDADGDFIIAWQNGEIVARRYNAAGASQGIEFQVNTHTTGNHSTPTAAMDSNGDFVIAWASQYQDGDGYAVYAQRYNVAGVPQGAEFRVNTYTTSHQYIPAAAMDADGDFVVTWNSSYQDGTNEAIYAQRYDVSVRPAIASSQFVWQTAPQRIEFTFDQDISASLTASDLVLQNLTTGATIPTASIVRTWNAATKTATFTFPTLPNGGSLPDGDYRATLPAAAVTNPAGTSLAVDYALDFFFLGGDADHDADVDLDDFNILASNFNQTGRNFSQGDFTYDGTVNLNDFNILAAKFNVGTAPPIASSRATTNLFGGGVLAVSNSLIALNRAIAGAGDSGGGNGQGGGIFNSGPSTVGTPSLTLQRSPVVSNQATVGGSAGLGVGGGLYLALGGVASADPGTLILGNDASTSDNDVFGVLV